MCADTCMHIHTFTVTTVIENKTYTYFYNWNPYPARVTTMNTTVTWKNAINHNMFSTIWTLKETSVSFYTYQRMVILFTEFWCTTSFVLALQHSTEYLVFLLIKTKINIQNCFLKQRLSQKSNKIYLTCMDIKIKEQVR